MSTTTTDGIRVTFRPAYWPERSSPEAGQFAFMYTVEIANVGSEAAQLRSRHWVITDANARVEEVRGLGLMWGVEFAAPPHHPAFGAPGRAVVDAAFRNGLLVYPAGGALPGSPVNQILVGPPLTITAAELEELGTLLRRSVREAFA